MLFSKHYNVAWVLNVVRKEIEIKQLNTDSAFILPYYFKDEFNLVLKSWSNSSPNFAY